MAITEEQSSVCRRYALLTHYLHKSALETTYWLLFLLLVLLLFFASWHYGRTQEALESCRVGSPESRTRLRNCLAWCAASTAVATAAVVLEVFVLLALQFCEGENLMSLYWATWTTIQFGGLTAVFGIVLSVYPHLKDRKHPPWALALGRSVLVIAGLGHFVSSSFQSHVKKVMSRRGQGCTDTASDMLPVSRRDTTPRRIEDQQDSRAAYDARLVGYTADGAPILQFARDPGSFGKGHASLVGTSPSGEVIVAFRNNAAAMVAEGGMGDVIQSPRPIHAREKMQQEYNEVEDAAPGLGEPSEER